ncbi:NUDIX hydrolase [Rhizorhabdus sp.]|uniref:NUDIX hydrolase n=1 Tax=Rhizorhabdus sp. TaxID=1968843 RepID=UPI001B58287A|nr:NUDIX hydrolase [Rhizorhabdus sp.]MBP8233492.1 NUDIX hydrolase [Rhizorhabdus sp.]
MTDDLPEASFAATLILLREQADGPPEIPMIGRSAQMRFAASRMVFPGGRLDTGDFSLAARRDLLVDGDRFDEVEIAHRVAAIRETIEEIGLAPCVEGLDSPDQIATLRQALHAGKAFAQLLEEHRLRLMLGDLHPFSRWRPDHAMPHRFDTRFYIARAPNLGKAVADGGESVYCRWGTAADHLARGGLIFPTQRNLERIAMASSWTDATAIAARYPMEVVTPWVEERDGVPWLHIPEHLGYPVTAQLLSEVDRAMDPRRVPRTSAPG